MKSVLAQTLTDWELIVCDSYSDDGAWEYFQKFAGDNRVRLFQVPRKGIYAGWNECLRRATGKFVYIATSDDTMTPDCLEKMSAALEKAESGKQKAEIETTDRRQKTEDGRQKTGLDPGGSACGGQTIDYRPRIPVGQGATRQNADQDPGNEERRTNNQEPRTRLTLLHAPTPPYPHTPASPSSKGLQSAVCGLWSYPRVLPADIAVCNFDYIDEHGHIIEPPLPPAGAFYGNDRYRAHRRSGYLEFLVHLLIGTSWTTMTAVLFRRSLLEKTGLFRENVPGALADRLWAYKSALNSDTIVVPETLATWRQHSEQGSAPRRGNRNLSSLRAARKLWRATVETVRECEPLLPAEWRRNPGLIDKLLWSERRHYLDHYCLSRTHLRHRRRDLARGAFHAAVLEPRYLVQRLLSGLAWPPDSNLSEADYLRQLLNKR